MGLPAFEADYLFLAPLIQARLESQVPDIPVDVCERADQVLAADRRQRVVMVMWAGDRPDTSDTGRAGAGASQLIHQRWLVMLAISSVGKQPDARSAGAGRALSQLHKALAGWTPEGAARAMRRALAPLQPTFTDSKAVYPLGFEITLTL